MNKFLSRLIIGTVFILTILGVSGCNVISLQTKPDFKSEFVYTNNYISWMPGFSEDIYQSWRKESTKRFKKTPFFFFAHGGYRNNEWVVFGPWDMEPKIEVEYIAEQLRNNHPNRDIIIVVCNGLGMELKNNPRVFYAKDAVWIWPDSYLNKISRVFRDLNEPNVVGDINEFVMSVENNK